MVCIWGTLRQNNSSLVKLYITWKRVLHSGCSTKRFPVLLPNDQCIDPWEIPVPLSRHSYWKLNILKDVMLNSVCIYSHPEEKQNILVSGIRHAALTMNFHNLSKRSWYMCRLCLHPQVLCMCQLVVAFGILVIGGGRKSHTVKQAFIPP